MLTKNREIKGIKVGKQIQIDDDTTILTSDINDIPKILQLLKDFQSISGLKTNIEKTIAYKLGIDQGPELPINHFGLTWSTGVINLLGVTLSNDKETSKDENFKHRIKGMETLTKIWASRNLSLKGKLTIINSLLIPKLIYPCTILDVPEDVVKQTSDLIKPFLELEKTKN